MGSCGTRPENESTTDCRAVRMLLDCTRYASRVGKAEMLLAVWSTAALLNQRFQRFRIDSDQIVLPWRTIFEPVQMLDFRVAANPPKIWEVYPADVCLLLETSLPPPTKWPTLLP